MAVKVATKTAVKTETKDSRPVIPGLKPLTKEQHQMIHDWTANKALKAQDAKNLKLMRAWAEAHPVKRSANGGPTLNGHVIKESKADIEKKVKALLKKADPKVIKGHDNFRGYAVEIGNTLLNVKWIAKALWKIEPNDTSSPDVRRVLKALGFAILTIEKKAADAKTTAAVKKAKTAAKKAAAKKAAAKKVAKKTPAKKTVKKPAEKKTEDKPVEPPAEPTVPAPES